MSTSKDRDPTVPPEVEDGADGRTDLIRSDVRILGYLAGKGADYPALIASNTGLHVGYVERRIEAMAKDGLVEAVSDEVVHRITAAGRDAVDDR